MDDKDLEVNHEEEDNLDDLDFSDPIEEEEEELPPKKDEEEAKSPLAPAEDEQIKLLRSELEAARADAAQAAKDRAEAWEEAENARTTAINGAIQGWQNDLARENRDVVTLQQQYARAQVEQDADKQADLIAKYNEKQQAINQLQSNIGNAQQQLNNKPVRAVKEPAKAEAPKRSAGELMADKWAAENPWYNDPAHKAKRDLVNELCAKAVEAKYDPSSLKFWNYIDKEVEAQSSKKDTPRRAQPAVRPVANKGGSVSSTNKNKPDAEILRAAHKALERRGISKADPRFETLQKSYYGTFKREIEKAKNNG